MSAENLHRALFIAVVCLLGAAAPVEGQVTPLDFQARVSLNDTTRQPIYGRAVAFSANHLTIRLFDGARIALDRRDIQRLDRRRRRWSTRRFTLVGCAIAGGAGAFIGANVPGPTFAGATITGCAIGGFAGLLTAAMGPVSWEPVSLRASAGR